MSTEVAAPVPVVATPVKAKAPKSPKKVKAPKVKGPKVPAAHPTYASMVKTAIGSLKDKKGSSRAAILKYIVQNYKVGENIVQVNISTLSFYIRLILVNFHYKATENCLLLWIMN